MTTRIASAGLMVLAVTARAVTADDARTLKQAFANRFLVGAAIGTHHVIGEESAAIELVGRQFDSITSENLLKWAEVHPEREQYNFAPADKYVAFGEKHGMFIVGHTLVWHNQTPSWVFEGDDRKPLTREQLLRRMREHIHTVVGRYKGRIHAWDVVNEAFEDDGRLRETPWKRIIGDDYLEHAFRFAHEADSDAELYYNDYNEWHPGKRRAISQLVKSLQAKDVRIDGVGMQGHWGMDYPSLEELDATIRQYRDLGVKVMVTELDINFLPRPDQEQDADVARNYAASEKLNPYAEGLPEEVNAFLACRYGDLFELLVKHADKIDRVTFWGVHDGHSWLNNWPIRGRTAHPLLFDRNLQPKPAFNAVLEAAHPSADQ
ncbi:MAG TPA: endo-1,4-beta-xylanase [Lacipirellula sp.]